jgi:dephospho-CoA kinase
VGVESTIVDLTEERPRLLRPGGITPEQLFEVIGEFIIDKAVTASVAKDAVVKAPGMKYRHYAPDCKVLIIDGDLLAAEKYIRSQWQPGNRVLCFEEEVDVFAGLAPLAYGKKADTDTLLAGLFAALRELDDPSIGTVFARCPTGSGKALAVQNRLEKAAGFCRINPREKHCTIGITGGTGCGKTTLLNAIRQMGGFVIDCDEVYHWLLERDEYLLNNIADAFPGTVENGVLDRKKLGNIVFRDEKALQELNFITHSAVRQEVLRRLPFQPTLVAIDAIGLFEGKLASLCDVTVAVTAPEDARVARLMARDGISEEYARKRIAAQHTEGWFRERCDYVLVNDGDLDAFATKCLAFLRQVAIMES